MPTATCPIPAHESSHVRNAQSARRRTDEGASEAEGCSQELAALVEHALLNDLSRLQQHRLRDRQAERLGGLKVDDQFELRGLLDGEVAWLGALRILST